MQTEKVDFLETFKSEDRTFFHAMAELHLFTMFIYYVTFAL